MYENMTWSEINDNLDYVFRYETTTRHEKESIKLRDWIYPKRDNLPAMLTKAAQDMRSKADK